jgi:lantibiotic modifying enzyme
MATETRVRNRKVVEPVKEVEAVAEKVEETAEGIPTVFDEFLRHQRRALDETGEAFQAFLPKEVKKHTRVAYKEAVEGYRGLFNSMVDELIERIEKIKIRPEDNKN